MDPMTVSALIGGASTVLGGALGKPAAPAYSSSTGYSTFDTSGWTVATGSASAMGGARSQTDFGQLAPLVLPLLVGGALLALAIWKKKSKAR